MDRVPWKDWILIIGFLVIIVVPGILTDLSRRAAPQNSGLMVHQQNQTDMASSGKQWTKIETWFSEHVGFRNTFIKLYNGLSVSLGISPNPEIILGTDQWLYLGSQKVLENYSGQRMFNDQELHQWKRYLTIKQKAMNDLGIGYVFIVAPDKIQIEQNHLPERYKAMKNTQNRTAQWLEYMQRETDVSIIDIRGMLAQGAAVLPVYKPTDSHWTEYGAAIAASALFNKLAYHESGSFRPPQSGDFESKLCSGGDLARMIRLEEQFASYEPVSRVVNLNPPREMTVMNSTMFARREVLLETPGKSHRLLIMGDSFVIGLKQQMATQFGQTLVVRLHNHQMRHLDPLAHYVQTFRPDYIVEVRVGRYLLDTVPEDPPGINVDGYPDWLKSFFVLKSF